MGWRLLSPLARRLKISLTLQPPPRSQARALIEPVMEPVMEPEPEPEPEPVMEPEP